MDSRYLETVRLLIDVAPFVFTADCFVLKGGTAINLSPRPKDIRREFASDFAGMTSSEVAVEQLESVRTVLFRDLPASLDEAERRFLLSVKRIEPEWEVLGVPGIERLPAIQWKLLNLTRLKKSNPKKYARALAELERNLLG